MFEFEERKKKNPRKSSVLFPYMLLQEAVLYLGRSWGSQQSVSLAGLQPVLLWKSVRGVLGHGVGLLLESQGAESRTTEHNFTLCTPLVMYESQKGTSRFLCGTVPEHPSIHYFGFTFQPPQVILNSKWNFHLIWEHLKKTISALFLSDLHIRAVSPVRTGPS